jgi:arylsulfatase A-like enzyme
VRRPVYDLVERFAAVVGGETTTIALADRRSRPRLTRGWSDPETLSDGVAVVMATERFATVRIDVARPMERTLVLRCARRGPAGAPPTRLAVLVNRRRVGVLTVGTAMADHRLVLPASVQQPGRNDLTISGPPRRRGGGTGVAYHSLRLEGPVDRRGPRLEDGAIALHGPATIRWVLRVPPAGVVSVAVEPRDAPLVATVEREGGAGHPVPLAAAADGTLAGDLGSWEGQIVRLALAHPGGSGSVRLRAPRVFGAADDQGAATKIERRSANVVLYVIDTLRADHLGCYGYAKPTSPRIDALAADGALFADALAQASWTRPATASIMTGVDPPVHGAMTIRQGFRPEVPTLAEVLAAAGHATAAFVTNVNVAGRWGFARGFDRYEYLPEDEDSPALHVGADVLAARVRDWLERADTGRPFFLYVHATDPHAPYTPSGDLERAWAAERGCGKEVQRLLGQAKRRPETMTSGELGRLIACYDAEIAFVDRHVGGLVDELARRGLLDDTVVVVTSDHGEEFLDHRGVEHGRTLYDEQLRIPLVMRFPDPALRGRKVAARARQIDVVPTVLDYLGLPAPAEVRGRSLLAAIAGEGVGDPIDSFAHTRLGGRALQSLTTGRWKVIARESGRGPLQAFDLARDPDERTDRARARPWLADFARESLATWLADVPRTGDPTRVPEPLPEADAATLRRLRALGYVE